MPEIINGRYVLQSEIGKGGMGAVMQAYDRLTDQTVALKRVRLNSDLQIGDSLAPYDTQEALRLVLAKEFQILAGLRHPHIISVLDYGFDADKQPFYTMTYLPEAQTILQAGADLDIEGKIDLIKQLLQGLAYLHRREILHRDIKPENVLVTDGVVRLLDFGLSQNVEEEGAIGGSPLYMAPEILNGDEVTPAADLYAIGVLFYQLLTGHHPFGTFDTGFYQRLLNEPPDLTLVDDQLRPILNRLLQKNLNERIFSANQVLHLLAERAGQTLSVETEAIRESYLQAATFVGRKDEVSHFKKCMGEAALGPGVVCLLGGESGVGKSRLLDECRTLALVSGWQVVTGQEVSEGGRPYQLWQGVIPRLALNCTLSDLEAGVLQEVVPSLGRVLEREIPKPPQLDGVEGEQRLVSTIIALLQRQADPTLLILEDIHWSQTSLTPLKQMLKVNEHLPGLLVVGSFRNDERPDLPEELPGVNLMTLDRLSDAEIMQLSGAMLGDVGTEHALVSLLAKETEGNTFFIIEVMRALAEDAGQLDEVGVRELPTQVFTQGMGALLQRRIHRVPAADRPLLQLAAVVGRQLDLNLLHHLGPAIDLNGWLQRIADATVIGIRDGQWFFSHDKLRQAVLTQLGADALKSSHRQVADALEQLYPDDPRYFSALLAHWQVAEDEERELAYLMPVVAHMVKVSADYDQGRNLATRGLSLLAPQDRRRIALLNLQADAYAVQGQFAAGERAAQEAYQLASALQDEIGLATSLNIVGTILFEQSRHSEAERFIQQSLEISQRTGDKQSIARSLLRLGSIAEFKKEYRIAEDYFQRSFDISHAIGDRQEMLNVMFYLRMLAAQYHNDYETSLEYAYNSLKISREIGNQRHTARALASLGIDLASTGDYAAAHGQFRQNLEMREMIGDQVGIGHAYLIMGEAYFFEGRDYARVLALEEKALEILMSINAYPLVGIAYGYLTLGHVALDAYNQAVGAALNHFVLHAELETDKSNGLVHTAVAKTLVAIEHGRADGLRLQKTINRITEITGLPATPIAYIEEGLKASTISQIRMEVLIACGALAIELDRFDMANEILLEAQVKAEKIGNRYKLDQIVGLLEKVPDGVH